MNNYIVENKEAILEQIEGYLADNKQEIVDSLLALMRVPSVQGEPLENAPYGKGCDEMVDATALLMEKHGFKTVKRNDLGYTYSVLDKGANKTIGAYCHGDVVPVDGEWLICPPFQPIIKDNFIFGRGCNDDKSGIVQMLYAAKFIRDYNLPLHSNLLLFTGVNEETGMGDIRAFVENEKMPDAGLVIDGGSYPCDLGERTVYKFYVEHKTAFTQIKRVCGGEAFNIILPEVEVVLAYDERVFAQMQALARGNENIRLVVEGKEIKLTAKGCAAPVTSPKKGKNAGLVAVEFLLGCTLLCEEDRGILQDMQALLIDSYGKGFGIEYTDSQFGALICGNGIISTENGKVKLAFDVRAGTEKDVDEMQAQTQKSVAKAWSYEYKSLAKGYLVREDDPFRKGLTAAYKLVAGEDAEIGGELMAGGTHARHLKNAYPVTNQVKSIIPDYPMPEGHGAYHQPDEKLHIDGFVQAIKVIIFLLLGVDAVLHKE